MGKYTLTLSLLCSLIAASVEAAPSASRTTGVAPLSVHFNADVAASNSEARPFHDYEYSWNFGDSASGTWGTDGKSKNTDKGPVSSHVYESPGTYTATLIIRNLSGVVDTASFTITVTNPDTVFSGTNTTCISTNTDFTGCPSGATQLTTNDLSSLPTLTTSGKRVLLRRGSTWTSSNTLYSDAPTNATTVHIGAYGTCQSPDSQGICSNAPQITITGSGSLSTTWILLYKSYDWRITDISFIGDKNTTGSILSGGMDIRRLLVLRVKTRGFYNPIGWAHWRPDETYEITENSVVSNDVRDVGEYVFYGGSNKLTLTGNEFHNSDTTHIARVWWSHLGVISHNKFSGSSLTNTNGRQALKFHGPKWGTEVGVAGPGMEYSLPYSSMFTVVSDNLFGGSGPWPVSIGPQNDASDERLSDIIFERNRFVSDYGQLSPMNVSVAAHFAGRYFTIRNNLIDISYQNLTVGDCTGLEVFNSPSAPSPLGYRIYNNTIYSDEALRNGATGIAVNAGSQDIEIKNNLISFLSGIERKSMIVDSSGVAVASNNLMATSQLFTDATAWPAINRNFSLITVASAAIDQGASVLVYDDIVDKARTGTFDIGVYEYTPGTHKHLRNKADGKIFRAAQ